MISVEEFSAEHLENFAASEVHEGEPWNQSLYEGRKSVWTMLRDGKPICFFGYDTQWKGVATIWAVIGTDFSKSGFSCSRLLKAIIGRAMKDTGTHRVQMYVKSNKPHLFRFASFLGFYHEAKLLGFGTDGSDYELMARLI